jgi:hypothetical protein
MERAIGRLQLGRLAQAHREARLVAIRAIGHAADEDASRIAPAVGSLSRVVAGNVRSAGSAALRGRVAGA